ncbi:SDR family NAD(P)-dependent oxidoreductase [Dermacoccus nishinomiyaensis]|uniref:SDR family NAD(P)-dependent oxidoreductase n=1 Tax=Dermacoccus nishinomiyaensis TaxID=1274 RepID=UPI0009392C14|nr:SDR family NAD(P)-dependent oxidoreductase [Dermacoccus nishinomiyaensis]
MNEQPAEDDDARDDASVTPEQEQLFAETAIDAEDMATTLRVIGMLHELPAGHPDIETVKRAAGTMYKRVRKARRAEARAAELGPLREQDAKVLASTATGSPLRIDDETKGIPLTSNVIGEVAGELNTPRGCYICHAKYTTVDAFYHWLCPNCAAMSHAKRHQRVDLRAKRALLTGGRAKIGMYIALMLLRDGAHLTITTRFPRDAARRFSELADSPEWIGRLKIVGIDLRDPTQVIALADEVAADGPLDILINNAAQTVRRSPGAYSNLTAGEELPLPRDVKLPQIVQFDRISDAHPANLAGTLAAYQHTHATDEAEPQPDAGRDVHAPGVTPAAGPLNPSDALDPARSAAAMTSLALSAGQASLEAHQAGAAVDAGGLLPDVVDTNSWKQKVEEVDPLELLEVQLCNSTAPFLLVSRLRPAMRAAVAQGARRAYVVNVSAMEGQFSRRYKGPGHPHTNMAKAALNMMTRTSAGEMFATDKILMTAVDTGWITDERPHHEKLRIAEEGWHAPLDLVDGAARVYDPIVMGENGIDQYGVFLKDFAEHPW